jgi:hypothetical protein
MNHATTSYPSAPLGDSKPLLVVTGLLLILGGIGCGGGMATWVTAAWQIAVRAGTPVEFPHEELAHLPPSRIMVAIVYAGFGLGAAWLGLGCILTRRWAWKLALSAGWFWVLSVVTGVISSAFILPRYIEVFTNLSRVSLPRGSGAPSPMPVDAIYRIVLILLGLIGTMLVLAPGIALIIVFGLKSTRVTCEFRDPKPRWTDAVPIPVLVLWLHLLTTAFALIAVAPGYWGLVPIAVAVNPLVSVPVWTSLVTAMVVASRDVAALRMRGWWLSLVIVISFGATGAFITQHLDPTVAYQNVSIPEEQKQKLIQVSTKLSSWVTPAVSSVLIACYVFWLRRFFEPAPQPEVL